MSSGSGRWTVPLGRVLANESQTSSTQLLEKIINTTTLSTQRVLHTHILELGEQLRLSSSHDAPGPSPGPAQTPHSPSSKQLVGGATESEKPWTEVFAQLAEEEKERALQKQRESLQARFAEALAARDRLEAEARQGQRVELLAQFERQRAGLRVQMEGEKRAAVEEACERLRTQVLSEAVEAGRREREAFQAEAQVARGDMRSKKRLMRHATEVERRVREECEEEARRERRSLQDTHSHELGQLHGRIQQLEERLDCITREKTQYETEFKKVQCSYRQFVDLTDSSLHSDYLLKLRRLGQEPGLTEAEAQTDDIINVCPAPWPLSHSKLH